MQKQETKQENVSIQLLPLVPKVLRVKVVGDTPLLIHKFGDTQKQAILDKQTHKATKRTKRDPKQEVIEATYLTEDGKDGIKAGAFKEALVEVAPYLPNLDKKKLRGTVHILGDIIPIKYKKKVVNESMVKINRGLSGEVRFRPEYRDWSVELDIKFNEALVSAEQIVNALNYAGFHMGVGDFRPQCSGTFGLFHVETA